MRVKLVVSGGFSCRSLSHLNHNNFSVQLLYKNLQETVTVCCTHRGQYVTDNV